MSDSPEAKCETQSPGRKRRGRLRKLGRALLIVLVVVLVILAALLYNPVRTLATLEKVDDFPLYVMHYHGTSLIVFFADDGLVYPLYRKIHKAVNHDACTSFAARNAGGDAVFGRNLDWSHRSSMLLFCDPPGGYASVAMVDLYYFGLDGLQEILWSKRPILLAAPHASIDGMNEWGVAIAQNAVPVRNTPKDPNKPTVLNSQIIRLVLDHARNVDEALALIQQYNVEFVGTRAHFHVADAAGDSAIVEYIDGGINIVRSDEPWQVSTNYLFSEPVQPDCWRYRTAATSLAAAPGGLPEGGAMDLLEAVKQNHTVWSVVYILHTGRIRLAMGKDYSDIHEFQLAMQDDIRSRRGHERR